MSYECVLTGLDGANPLGFLAALGVLRTLSHTDDKTTYMRWQITSGGWRPLLTTSRALTNLELSDQLHAALASMRNHAAWSIGDDLNVDSGVYRAYAHNAAISATPTNAIHAEYAAAFASESVLRANSGQPELVADSDLRAVGGGQQRFISFIRELVEITTANDLHKSLFELWRYDDDKPSMRWDPADDRRYALRWSEPSGDPIRTMRGANRLAIEGLPLLPVMPTTHRLETTGFTTSKGSGTVWKWPLWDRSIPLAVVRSLLADRRLRDHKVLAELSAIGVCAVFKSQRLTVAKYRNFTMGTPA